jgi:hypothetical protein
MDYTDPEENAQEMAANLRKAIQERDILKDELRKLKNRDPIRWELKKATDLIGELEKHLLKIRARELKLGMEEHLSCLQATAALGKIAQFKEESKS